MRPVTLNGVLTTVSTTHRAELKMTDQRSVFIAANDQIAASLWTILQQASGGCSGGNDPVVD